jgi:multiple sugar transport system permease protein
VIGTALALGLLNYVRRTRKFLQAIIVIPMAMTPVAAALMWKYIYNSTYGILNYGLSFLHIAPVDWLGSTKWSLISIVLVDIWQWTPFVFLIVLAGLESIPQEILDMGRTDGANRLQLITNFILPQIKYFVWVAIFLRVIDSVKTLDSVYVLTAGGPGSSTETLSLYGYRLGFFFFNTAYASAESIVLVCIVTLLTAFLMRFFIRIT